MAFKKLFVTGAEGMLGSDLVPFLKAKGYDVFGSTLKTMNVLAPQEDLQNTLEAFGPDVVIHCGAYTNVDGAEREPELAMLINKDGTHKLAQAARNIGAIFIYISTDFVFDGLKQEPYDPLDRPNPINSYGLSKYYGELMVTEHLEMYYIIRTSWTYGIHGKNFVQFVLDNAREGKEIPVVTDWIGSPTWTGSLCAFIENVMNSGAYGVYHGADDGVISRFDQARAICHAAGYSSDCIKPVSSSELNLAANRPTYSPLASPNMPVPSWETSLQAYLEQYKQLAQVN